MSNIDYNEVPKNFAHCTAENCPAAETCLRAIAWKNLPDDKDTVIILNPAKQGLSATCSFYRDSSPTRFALGFIDMQKHMYPDQYYKFMNMLTGYFGHNPYFMRRRGAMSISPKEQNLIRSVLKKVGADENMEFDRYVMKLNWNR